MTETPTSRKTEFTQCQMTDCDRREFGNGVCRHHSDKILRNGLRLRDESNPMRCSFAHCPEWASDVYMFNLCDAHIRLIAEIYQEQNNRRSRDHRPIPHPRRDAGTGYVYYIQVGDRLKVGYTANLTKRIRQYPPNSLLLAVQPGVTIAREKVVHSLLSAHLVEGREWFALNDETRSFVSGVVAQFGEPPKIMGLQAAPRNRQSAIKVRDWR